MVPLVTAGIMAVPVDTDAIVPALPHAVVETWLDAAPATLITLAFAPAEPEGWTGPVLLLPTLLGLQLTMLSIPIPQASALQRGFRLEMIGFFVFTSS
jgi:hypothetical protein